MRWGKVWVSPWLLALIALFFAIDKSVYAPLVVLSALLHEMGHLAALRNCGIEVREVCFHPFGIEMNAPGLTYLPYRDELCIAAAGPLANFLAALCTVAPVALVGAFDGALFFTVCNLALALLNLMPVSGHDGGRMLSALVLPAMGLARGETLLSVVSAVASAAILAAGLLLLYVTRYNFSLALIGCYLLARRALGKRPAAA